MKKSILYTALLLSGFALLNTGCSKWAEEKRSLAPAIVAATQPVSDAAPVSGPIKGTMLSGKTYTINGDVLIKPGDTLAIQPGVHINVTNKAGIFVQGSLVSVGTQAQQIWITVDSLEKLKNDAPNQDPSKDPAFVGGWAGIYCAATCPMLILKWTHVEFGGNGLS